MSELLEIGKCKSCKAYWERDKLKKFIFLVPIGDGIVKEMGFLCDDCYNSLNEGLKTQKTKREEDL